MFRTPVFFDGAEAAAPAPAPAPEAPAAVTPAEAPAAEGGAAPVSGTAPADTPPADQPAPVDWEARVRDEWGGEDKVKSALDIHSALQTREGIQALAWESLRALGVGDDRIKGLFGAPAVSAPADGGEETIEALLADQERVLTPKEVARIVEHYQSQDREERSQRESEERAHAEVQSVVSATVTELGVAGDDRDVVLTLANQFLVDHFGRPVEATQATPDQIKGAIRQGHAKFQEIVAREAKAHLESKGAAHDALPQPLTGGSASGGEALPEPSNLDEAKARVRKAMGVE